MGSGSLRRRPTAPCNESSRTLAPAAPPAHALEIAKAAVEATVVGPPEEGVAIGPVVSKVQYDKIQAPIAKGTAEGAALVTGMNGNR